MPTAADGDMGGAKLEASTRESVSDRSCALPAGRPGDAPGALPCNPDALARRPRPPPAAGDSGAAAAAGAGGGDAGWLPRRPPPPPPATPAAVRGAWWCELPRGPLLKALLPLPRVLPRMPPRTLSRVPAPATVLLPEATSCGDRGGDALLPRRVAAAVTPASAVGAVPLAPPAPSRCGDCVGTVAPVPVAAGGVGGARGAGGAERVAAGATGASVAIVAAAAAAAAATCGGVDGEVAGQMAATCGSKDDGAAVAVEPYIDVAMPSTTARRSAAKRWRSTRARDPPPGVAGTQGGSVTASVADARDGVGDSGAPGSPRSRAWPIRASIAAWPRTRGRGAATATSAVRRGGAAAVAVSPPRAGGPALALRPAMRARSAASASRRAATRASATTCDAAYSPSRPSRKR